MIVWACIAPHGGELIPELANGSMKRMATTRAAMERLGQGCAAAKPDLVVVYTPHGLCIDGYMCLSVASRVAGSLTGETGEVVSTEFEVDRAFATALGDSASALGIPVVEAAYDKSGAPAELLPLDWGALVPLWFMGAKWKNRPSVVVVCPSRSLSRRQLIQFGRATAEVAADSEKRVALVCSADQGHGHAEDGPYGFSPTSSSYDRAYCQAVRANALDRLLHWRDDWIDSALPDSYWQTLMLHGAMGHTPMRGELLSYEAPTYFGMACAEYRPDAETRGRGDTETQ